MRHRLTISAATALMLLAVLMQQFLAQNRPSATPIRPTPRFRDGRVNFGPPEGETGLWNATGSKLYIPENLDQVDDGALQGVTFAGLVPGEKDLAAVQATAARFPGKPKFSEIPYQPWARELMLFRLRNEFEPYTRCKPSGGPRQVATAYGTELVDMPELKRFYITQTGGPHSFRIIFMDGRAHPKDLEPSYYGHSVGHWEGDTLVADTVGFNERFWMDSDGSPTTEKLHLIERFSRPDFDTLKYEVTVDDPGAYTAPWTSGYFMRWAPGTESFEYICQENNHAPELLFGRQQSVDRSSPIVP